MKGNRGANIDRISELAATFARESDPETRKEVAAQLGWESEDALVQDLLAAVSDDSVDRAAAAVLILGELRNDAAREHLPSILRDLGLDDMVRREAVLALRDLGAVDVLLEALADEEQGWIVRGEAALALGALRAPQALKRLIDALNNAHELVRRDAAEALGMMGEKAALEPLKYAATNDRNRDVRRAAADAARRLASEFQTSHQS